MVQKRINITVDEKLIKKFQEYCRKRGMKVSTRIELLIRKELKQQGR